MNEAPRPAAVPRPAGLRETVATVLWSFIGIRKRADHDRAAVSLHPVHVIVAGVIATALFVLVLLLIVRSVVK